MCGGMGDRKSKSLLLRRRGRSRRFDSNPFKSTPWRQKSAKIELKILLLTTGKVKSWINLPLLYLTVDRLLYEEAKTKSPVGLIA